MLNTLSCPSFKETGLRNKGENWRLLCNKVSKDLEAFSLSGLPSSVMRGGRVNDFTFLEQCYNDDLSNEIFSLPD